MRNACLVIALSLVVAACGSRGPLDIGAGGADSLDAGSDATNAAPDASGADGSADAASDGAIGDGAPDAPSLVNCGVCVAQNCGPQVLMCVTNPTCRAALQCVITKCLRGGSPDPQCIFGCTNGDQQVLQEMLQIFTCVLTNCGSACAGALGGLGGGGGGGGGGDAGHAPAPPGAACRAFAQWDVCEDVRP